MDMPQDGPRTPQPETRIRVLVGPSASPIRYEMDAIDRIMDRENETGQRTRGILGPGAAALASGDVAESFNLVGPQR
jgi:hypothetical protein